jgi:hypothetical protein
MRICTYILSIILAGTCNALPQPGDQTFISLLEKKVKEQLALPYKFDAIEYQFMETDVTPLMLQKVNLMLDRLQIPKDSEEYQRRYQMQLDETLKRTGNNINKLRVIKCRNYYVHSSFPVHPDEYQEDGEITLSPGEEYSDTYILDYQNHKTYEISRWDNQVTETDDLTSWERKEIRNALIPEGTLEMSFLLGNTDFQKVEDVSTDPAAQKLGLLPELKYLQRNIGSHTQYFGFDSMDLTKLFHLKGTRNGIPAGETNWSDFQQVNENFMAPHFMQKNTYDEAGKVKKFEKYRFKNVEIGNDINIPSTAADYILDHIKGIYRYIRVHKDGSTETLPISSLIEQLRK